MPMLAIQSLIVIMDGTELLFLLVAHDVGYDSP